MKTTFFAKQIKQFKLLPKSRLIVYGIIALFALIYLGWSILPQIVPKWFTPPVSTEVFQPTKPAVKQEKVTGPKLNVPLKTVPKAAIKKAFPEIPAEEVDDKETEYVDTAIIPEAEEGGKVVSQIDTKTGEVTTKFKANETPWFEFERKNYIGIGATIGTRGQTGEIYYKRDIVQVKALHLQVMPIAVSAPIDGVGSVEIKTGVYMEGRW